MIVIVDTRYVLYRSHYKMKHLSFNGTNTGGIFGLARTLRSFRTKYGEETKFLLAHDNGIPQFRKDLSDDFYKKKRTTTEEVRESVDRQQAIVQYHLPLPQWVVEQAEADDLIASFCASHDTSVEDLCIITNDKDLYTNLREGIFIQKSVNERPFTVDDLYFEYNEATPDIWPLIKAIAGDKSDNIPGVPGYKELKASKIIKQGKIAELMGSETVREIVERNLKIVTPITSYIGWPEPEPIEVTPWNVFCNAYGMVKCYIDQNLSELFQPNLNSTKPTTPVDKDDLSYLSVLKNFNL